MYLKIKRFDEPAISTYNLASKLAQNTFQSIKASGFGYTAHNFASLP